MFAALETIKERLGRTAYRMSAFDGGQFAEGEPSSKRHVDPARRRHMLKIVGWGVAIVFIIGLLVITGVLKAIF